MILILIKSIAFLVEVLAYRNSNLIVELSRSKAIFNINLYTTLLSVFSIVKNIELFKSTKEFLTI